MYRRILVPLDGSEVRDQVLRHASMLARNERAELILLTVLAVKTPDPLFSTPWVQAAAQQEVDALKIVARGSLERDAEGLRRSHLRVSVRVATGKPVDAILNTARAVNADAIVMSAHGIRGNSPWVDGDTTTQVMRQAPVPVFLVGGGLGEWDSLDSTQPAPQQG